jgi:phosphomannomutase
MTGTLMVGVSGIRGIVGTDLTSDVVERYAHAFGTWATRHGPRVVIGRDSRGSGPEFARAASRGLGRAGCEVIDVGLAPTPTIQLAVEHHRAGGGIAITASHNPIEWNALKFIGPDGVFLDEADGARVLELARGDGRSVPAAAAVTLDPGAIERHVARVLNLEVLDVGRIRRRRFRVALDAVRGAGGAIMPQLLERLGCEVLGINLETDGAFPRPPEPVPEHLQDLVALVRRTGADVGFAVDPDVDRLAIVDEAGTPIGEDYTLAFAVRAVLGDGGSPPGPVVCNLSTSLVVEDAARAYSASVERTMVGEAHVARRIRELQAPIGGEGNGGVIYPALHAGRDAPLAAALVLELLAREGVSPGTIVARARRYVMVKTKVPRGAALDAVYTALSRAFADAVLDRRDGLRLAWPDRWLHVRPSNTEPVVRLIAEAPRREGADALIDESRRLIAAG